MKDLFEYAEELEKSTKFEKVDLLNAIQTMRDIQTPEETIHLLIEGANIHPAVMRISDIVRVIFYADIEKLQRQRWERLLSLSKVHF